MIRKDQVNESLFAPEESGLLQVAAHKPLDFDHKLEEGEDKARTQDHMDEM